MLKSVQAYTHTHLLKPLLLQTDDIKVKICPQAIGPVESDSSSQAIPVGLMREAECSSINFNIN